jgi:hypothetical protein
MSSELYVEETTFVPELESLSFCCPIATVLEGGRVYERLNVSLADVTRSIGELTNKNTIVSIGLVYGDDDGESTLYFALLVNSDFSAFNEEVVDQLVGILKRTGWGFEFAGLLSAEVVSAIPFMARMDGRLLAVWHDAEQPYSVTVEPAADGSADLVSVEDIESLNWAANSADGALIVNEPIRVEPGTWVRFNRTMIAGCEAVVVKGMLGRCAPGGEYVCTPGLSTFIALHGGGGPYGYFDETFEALGRLPTDVELAASKDIFDRRAELAQAQHGWQGIVQIGNRLMPEHKAHRSLCQLIEQTKRALAKGDAAKAQRKGSVKRISKVLRAFAGHPNGATANLLALQPERLGAATVGTWLDSVQGWLDESRFRATTS